MFIFIIKIFYLYKENIQTTKNCQKAINSLEALFNWILKNFHILQSDYETNKKFHFDLYIETFKFDLKKALT